MDNDCICPFVDVQGKRMEVNQTEGETLTFHIQRMQYSQIGRLHTDKEGENQAVEACGVIIVNEQQ